MENYGYIYKTTNLINGRIYIGQKKGEFNPIYFGSGKIIKLAIKKYGENNFRIDILVYAMNREHLNNIEIEYISKYRSLFPELYNIAKGGEGGFCHTENTKQIMRKPKSKEAIENNVKARKEAAERRGYYFSQRTIEKMKKPKSKQHIENIIKSHLGYKHTEEQKKKISEGNTGKVIPQEVRDRIRKTLMGKKHSPERVEKNRQGQMKRWANT